MPVLPYSAPASVGRMAPSLGSLRRYFTPTTANHSSSSSQFRSTEKELLGLLAAATSCFGVPGRSQYMSVASMCPSVAASVPRPLPRAHPHPPFRPSIPHSGLPQSRNGGNNNYENEAPTPTPRGPVTLLPSEFLIPLGLDSGVLSSPLLSSPCRVPSRGWLSLMP